MNKPLSLVVVGFLCTVLLTPVQAQIDSQEPVTIEDMNSAIEQASQQGALTQRIMKSYALVLLDVKKSKFQKELTDSLVRYKKVQDALATYPGAATVADNVMKKAAGQWRVIQKITAAPPSTKTVGPLQTALDGLLDTNEQIVAALTDAAGSEEAPLVVLSDRQGMLSQRVAALYMIHALGAAEESFTENMQNSTFEFKLGLEELAGSELNNGEINKSLKKIRTQFKMLEFSVNKKGNTYFPFVVSQAAEKITGGMLDVHDEYVSLLGDS